MLHVISVGRHVFCCPVSSDAGGGGLGVGRAYAQAFLGRDPKLEINGPFYLVMLFFGKLKNERATFHFSLFFFFFFWIRKFSSSNFLLNEK